MEAAAALLWIQNPHHSEKVDVEEEDQKNQNHKCLMICAKLWKLFGFAQGFISSQCQACMVAMLMMTMLLKMCVDANDEMMLMLKPCRLSPASRWGGLVGRGAGRKKMARDDLHTL